MAARNALVKALRAEKDREAATTVAAIRRPAWSEWALNVTSGSHPDEVAAFAEAAAAVRDAQDAAVDGRPVEIRSALQDLRQRTTAVATPANAALQAEAAKGDLPALMAQLAEIAGSAAAVERLRNGTVGTGEAADSDLFAGLAAAPAPRLARAAGGKKAASADKPAGKAPDPPAPTAAERRRLMRALADAERDLKRAQRAATRAEEDLAAAVEAAEAAERLRADAAAEVDEANAAVEQAEAERAAAAEALDASP